MPHRRLRTSHYRRRAREKFWDRNGERLRLALIGGGVVIATALMAQLLLR